MWPFKKKSSSIANLYRRCNVLPIHNFNEISTNNDFDYLKVNRNDVVSQIELEETWLLIMDEFYRISKNINALSLIKKQCNLMLLQKKLVVFEVLKICIDKNIDVSNECLKYRIDKTKINIHIGMLKNDISRITSTFPKEINNNNSESQFDDTIAIIIKNGFQINRFTTVVSEWCSILNIIEKQNKANK